MIENHATRFKPEELGLGFWGFKNNSKVNSHDIKPRDLIETREIWF